MRKEFRMICWLGEILPGIFSYLDSQAFVGIRLIVSQNLKISEHARMPGGNMSKSHAINTKDF